MSAPTRAWGADGASASLERQFEAPSLPRPQTPAPRIDDKTADGVRRRESLHRRALLVADICAMVGSLFLTITIAGDDLLRAEAFLCVPLLIFMAKASGLYDRDDVRMRPSTLDEVPQLFQLATLVALIAKIAEGTFFQGQLGNLQLVGFWASLTAGMIVCRFLARQLVVRVAPSQRCLVIGDHAVLERLEEKLHHDTWVTLVGSLPFEHVAHDIAAARKAVLDHRAERVVIAPPAVGSHEEAMILIRAIMSMDVRVSVHPGVLEVIGSSVEFDQLPGMTILGVRRFGLTTSSRVLKRSLDLLIASIVTVLAAPFMALIALAIRMDTKGPAFFRQARVGRNGETFEIVKFRTMVDGADEMREALEAHNQADGVFKIPDDPRITRVGGLLRRTSLDELPQLLNVFKGEMSIVGPRPLVVYEDRRVTGLDRRRLDLTPGMTGPWQVAGSARMSLTEMVKMDYLYVAGWSLWNDVKIIARTAHYVVSQRGH